MDLHQPFLEELTDTATQQDLTERISTVNCSMDQLLFSDHSFDMIWAEGALYNIGFDTALRAWRRLLTPSGVLVVTC